MTAPLPPLEFQWNGEAMVPRWPKRADRLYVVGEVYPLAPWEERSQVSHNHEFAFIGEAFGQLPEQYKHEAWAQSPEHLRKYALIRTGYCNTQTYTCGSRAEAERWARNLRPLDEFSIVDVEGTTVRRFTAMSQSRRAMGKKLFGESKSAILDYLSGLIEVDPETLRQNAGMAA